MKARAWEQEREQEAWSQYMAWVEASFVSPTTLHTLLPSTVDISLSVWGQISVRSLCSVRVCVELACSSTRPWHPVRSLPE